MKYVKEEPIFRNDTENAIHRKFMGAPFAVRFTDKDWSYLLLNDDVEVLAGLSEKPGDLYPVSRQTVMAPYILDELRQNEVFFLTPYNVLIIAGGLLG